MENAPVPAFMTIPLDTLRTAFAMTNFSHGINAAALDRAGRTLEWLNAVSDTDLLHWLNDAESRNVVKLILDANFKGMTIMSLNCNDEFAWEMKLKVGDYMQKVHHRYKVHMVADPRRLFNDLDELKDDEREIMENTQEELPFDEQESERSKALANVSKQRLNVLARLQDMRNDCPEISFEVTVIEAKWPDDGTVLRCKIPGSIVNLMNDNRMYLKAPDSYIVRLEKIGE